ncbi:hypothetical protein ANTRET_LOCUS7860 [Anthophora retusa]
MVWIRFLEQRAVVLVSTRKPSSVSIVNFEKKTKETTLCPFARRGYVALLGMNTRAETIFSKGARVHP